MRLARAGVTALAVLLVAALVALGQRNRAVEQARIATARQLAATAVANLGTRLDLAQLLAAEAYRTDPNPETRAALLQAVTSSPALVHYWHGDAPVTALANSADGTTIVAGTANGTVTRWRARTGERSDVLRLGAPVTSVAVSGNGDTIVATDAVAATAEDREAVLWNGGSRQATIATDGRFFSFTNGGTEIPVWATSDGVAAEPPEVSPRPDFNPRPDRTARGPGHYPEALAIDAGGNRAAVADTGTITVSDTTQGRVIATLPGNGSVNDSGLRFVAGSDQLLSVSGAAVALWDLRQLNRIATTTVMVVPWGCNACPGPSVAVSPDGRWEALVDGSGRAAVVRSSNGPPRSETVIASGDRGGYSYGPLLWSADSTRLFLSREDGSVEVRAAADGVPVVEQWQPANSEPASPQ